MTKNKLNNSFPHQRDSSTIRSRSRGPIKRMSNEEMEILFRNLNLTSLTRYILVLDIEALAGFPIAIGVALFDIHNLENMTVSESLIKFLHPDDKEDAYKDKFWGNPEHPERADLIPQMLYEGQCDKATMLESIKNKFELSIKKIISQKKIGITHGKGEDIIVKDDLTIVLGSLTDIEYLAKLGIYLSQIGEFSHNRVVILRQLYYGGISPIDNTITGDNIYTTIQRGNPKVAGIYKAIKRKLGKGSVHDPIYDAKNNLGLYLAYCIGIVKDIETYNLFKQMLSF